MRILIDTNAFIWFFEGNPKLSLIVRGILEDKSLDLFLSVASLWELAILVSIHKVTLAQPFDIVVPRTLDRNDIALLDISLDHTTQYISLPMYHRDPFDRLIVAQTLAEQLTIVSSDAMLDVYGVDRRW